MIKALLRYICGTLTVKVKGGGCERFLNLVYGSKIKIWNLRRVDETTMTFCIRCGDFRKLRFAVVRSHVKIHIIKKHGLTQRTRNYRRRYGLFIGCGIIFAAIYMSSFFIWSIDVAGCEQISVQEVLTRLSENGFKTGCLKSSFVAKEVENNFLKNNPKVSWISINVKGTTAYVELREKKDKPELIDANEPCSIYAARDGVIASVSAYMGYGVVEKGDTVAAGDLVVTGNYTDKYGVEYKLHSYAKVMAYTTRSKSVTVPLKRTQHVKTGGVKNKYSLKIIRFNIPLYFGKKILYNKYDVTRSERSLSLSKSFKLPVSLCKTTYTEVEDQAVSLTEQQALNEAYEQLRDYEYSLAGIAVTNREYTEQKNKDSVTVKLVLDCFEDIGIPQKIE